MFYFKWKQEATGEFWAGKYGIIIEILKRSVGCEGQESLYEGNGLWGTGVKQGLLWREWHRGPRIAEWWEGSRRIWAGPWRENGFNQIARLRVPVWKVLQNVQGAFKVWWSGLFEGSHHRIRCKASAWGARCLSWLIICPIWLAHLLLTFPAPSTFQPGWMAPAPHLNTVSSSIKDGWERCQRGVVRRPLYNPSRRLWKSAKGKG